MVDSVIECRALTERSDAAAFLVMRYSFMMTFRLIFAFGIGVAVLSGFSSTVWGYYPGIPASIPIWHGISWTLGAIVIGLFLYALRCWLPFYYGALEVLAAIFTIYLNISPAKQPRDTFCDGSVLWGLGCVFQSWLIILAGIYIFVRGMDNMGRRLPNFVPDSMRNAGIAYFHHHEADFR